MPTLAPFKLEGIDQALLRLDAAVRITMEGAARGLVAAANHLYHHSQRLVPVQFGELRASARMSGIMYDPHGYTTSVGYGLGVPYAIYVHEDLTKAHGARFNRKYARIINSLARVRRGRTVYGSRASGMFPRRPQECAKFLQRPLLEHRDYYIYVIWEHATRAFR